MAQETPKPVRENSHGRTEAFYASQKDDTGALLEACLDEGVDADAVDDQGNTVLHWTSWNSRFNGMRILLKRGANPNIRNYKGHTPLHHVINRTKVDHPFPQVQCLLEHGADPTLADHMGHTAYHALAVRSKSLPAEHAMRIAQLLSEKGGTDGWFTPNNAGSSALDIAAEARDPNLAVFVAALQATILEHGTTQPAPKSSSPTRRL